MYYTVVCQENVTIAIAIMCLQNLPVVDKQCVIEYATKPASDQNPTLLPGAERLSSGELDSTVDCNFNSSPTHSIFN